MSRRPGRPGRLPVPPTVEAVRQRIEDWRTTRTKRTHMPKDLWAAAAAVAREHGLWFVSRCLRVNYENLKKRVGASAKEDGSVAGFVELPTGPLIGQSATPTTVIELARVDGAKLTVRFEGHGALDVPALTAALWQHDR